jgi:hypothetical protein
MNPRRWCFLSAVATTMICMMICMSSGAEARNERHHGYFSHGDRDQKSVPRTSDNRPSRSQANGFGWAIGQMIGACEERVTELKTTPFDDVTRTVRPDEDQRDALEHIRNTMIGAADTLAATCPKDIPPELSEKLDLLTHVLDRIAASLAALRPAFVTFYGLLDDEQKARLVVNFSHNSQPKSDRDAPVGENEHRFANGIDAKQAPVCRQWVAALRTWPIREIDTGMSLSDEQRAALYEVAAAIYRAAGGLVMSCPAETPLTPVGRLDAEQKTLQAMRQGVDAIQSVLADFENSLNEEQKKWLDKVVTDPRAPR